MRAPRPDLPLDRAGRGRGARRPRAARPAGRRSTATSTAAPSGAGHFVKMVHNGIEYGVMAAYAEGLNVLHRANIGSEEVQASAEIAPLDDPEYYRYDIDVPEVAEVWRRGSVIASWLLDLTAAALATDPTLDGPLGPGVRLGRGPLDDPRGGRRGRAGAGALGGPLRALLVARRVPLRRPAPVGDAPAVRRAPRAEVGGADPRATGLARLAAPERRPVGSPARGDSAVRRRGGVAR